MSCSTAFVIQLLPLFQIQSISPNWRECLVCQIVLPQEQVSVIGIVRTRGFPEMCSLWPFHIYSWKNNRGLDMKLPFV